MKTYNKLIRDRITEIIKLSGKKYEIRTLDSKEYKQKLDEKLREELDEYLIASENDKIEELSDLTEVIYAIVESEGYSIEEFEKIRKEKQYQRGGFKDRTLLVKVYGE